MSLPVKLAKTTHTRKILTELGAVNQWGIITTHIFSAYTLSSTFQSNVQLMLEIHQRKSNS